MCVRRGIDRRDDIGMWVVAAVMLLELLGDIVVSACAFLHAVLLPTALTETRIGFSEFGRLHFGVTSTHEWGT